MERTPTLLIVYHTHTGGTRQMAEAVREVTKLRADVQLVAPGSLPNDGKVIEDARSYA